MVAPCNFSDTCKIEVALHFKTNRIFIKEKKAETMKMDTFTQESKRCNIYYFMILRRTSGVKIERFDQYTLILFRITSQTLQLLDDNE